MSKSSLLTFLLNATWQVALITTLAAIGSRLLRNASARYRHWLWMIALVLAVSVPVATTAKISVQQLLQPTMATPQFERTPTGFEVTAPAQTTFTSPSVLSLNLDSRIAMFLIAVYFAFVAFRLFRFLQAWVTTRRIRKSAFRVELSPMMAEVLRKCESVVGMRSKVEVLGSNVIPVPVTIGIGRAVIILPQQLLEQEDSELLTSAIGHELIHVKRRDYLLNLCCELLFLPVSFNPLAALLRRRIKQTRELSCDELVAERVLNAETYARSLVQLVSSVPTLRQLSVTTTVGIADADILEARIMSLLNKPQLQARWKTFVLVGASLLLLVPCVVAASFGGRYEIGTQDPRPREQPREQQREQEIQEVERKREAAGQEIKVREVNPQMREEMTRKMQFEREMVTVKRAALMNLARVSMDQAIQIATSQYAGKVLQASLDVDKWEEPGKIAKDGKIFYRVVVLSTDNSNIATHVWVDAVDGTIIKTEKELPREAAPRR